MTAGHGDNGHSLPALWRWLAVTLVGLVGIMAGLAWQNLRETQRTVTRDLRSQVGKQERELAALQERVAALKERLDAVEWYVKGRIPREAPH